MMAQDSFAIRPYCMMAFFVLFLFGLMLACQAQGTLSWAKQVGRWDSVADSVVALPDGGVFVTGEFSHSATFGAGEPGQTVLTAIGGDNMFIARYRANGTLVWVKQTTGGFCYGLDVAVLSDGGALVAGNFDTTATFGPGEAGQTLLTSTRSGTDEIFLARYRGDGTLVWAKQAGGNGNDYVHGIAVFPDGSAAITGWFAGTATFGPGEAGETSLTAVVIGQITEDQYDIFIARYRADGTLIWAKRAGDTFVQVGKDIAALPDGGMLVTGDFYRTCTFGSGEAGQTTLTLTGTGSWDVFLARYHADGTFVWAKQAGGAGSDVSESVAVLPDGGSLVTGSFEQTTTFGLGEAGQTTLTAVGTTNLFLARYHADGTLVWVRQVEGSYGPLGSLGINEGKNLAILPDGGALLAGMFRPAATFGPGEAGQTVLTASDGSLDLFLARYRADGTLAWVKQAGGDHCSLYAYGLAFIPSGGALVTGKLTGTATFGQGEAGETTLTASGGNNLFLACYDVGSYLPDAFIRKANTGPFLGDNTYNTAAEQTLRQTAVTGRTVRFDVRVANDGTAGALRVNGTAGPVGWTVRYLNAAGADITAAVTDVETGWQTAVLPATLRVEITPTTAVPGAVCSVPVTVTAMGDATMRDTVIAEAVTPLPLTAGLSAGLPAPRVVGTAIPLTAMLPAGRTVQVRFRAGYQLPTGAWAGTILRDYNTSATCTWMPTIPARYTLQALAREVSTGMTATATLMYQINPTLSDVRLAAASASPHPAGTRVTLTATPTGGARVQYLFRLGYVENGAWHWSVLRPYTASPLAVWTPTVPRQYTLVVWARETGSTAPYQVNGILGYRVTNQ